MCNPESRREDKTSFVKSAPQYQRVGKFLLVLLASVLMDTFEACRIALGTCRYLLYCLAVVACAASVLRCMHDATLGPRRNKNTRRDLLLNGTSLVSYGDLISYA